VNSLLVTPIFTSTVPSSETFPGTPLIVPSGPRRYNSVYRPLGNGVATVYAVASTATTTATPIIVCTYLFPPADFVPSAPKADGLIPGCHDWLCTVLTSYSSAPRYHGCRKDGDSELVRQCKRPELDAPGGLTHRNREKPTETETRPDTENPSFKQRQLVLSRKQHDDEKIPRYEQ